jgi:hypothetical protein
LEETSLQIVRHLKSVENVLLSLKVLFASRCDLDHRHVRLIFGKGGEDEDVGVRLATVYPMVIFTLDRKSVV